ncbi:WhiB family transcriptional regulator [Gardnerella vaginalis]|uniref:Transcriptional regulator WhiB n=1 Tax=Gardnerella vaginalis TaxID=2702 RepID=A0A133NYX1_GARVA|nr:WhiB family transcriptional regulator [Gardnerella vaginalis]EPI43664.1 transcription factor WhiB [Gardnerella vaginalis JCP8481A]EPI44649.1 transcription factor WhiB [Gardnerella vaginalis JCP8481B]KXA21474.1 transcription factor WhiB [Gardnerella vaginalis]
MSNSFNWRNTAACRDKDPELFFPLGSAGIAMQQLEEAKAVCRSCKVATECLRCALETNQDYGVWGGLSEDERRTLKRRVIRARKSQDATM